MFIVTFDKGSYDERHEYANFNDYLDKEYGDHLVKYINAWLKEAHPKVKFELTDECKEFCGNYVKSFGADKPWYALNKDGCSYDNIRLNNLIVDAAAAFLGFF